MAFTKLLAFTKKVADLADKPTGTPAEIKAQFDAAPEELRGSFNQLIDDLNKQTQLWSGAVNLGLDSAGAPQLVSPSKKLSECKNGWLLIWSDYDGGGVINDYDFAYTFIPKFIVTVLNGKQHLFAVPTTLNATTASMTVKKVVVYDEKMVGHSDNKETANGSNDVVLRYVIEV